MAVDRDARGAASAAADTTACTVAREVVSTVALQPARARVQAPVVDRAVAAVRMCALGAPGHAH